jgi:hypothetical protein
MGRKLDRRLDRQFWLLAIGLVLVGGVIVLLDFYFYVPSTK